MVRTRSAALLLALTCSGASVAAGASPDYFADLIRGRREITSGTIELVVTRKVDTKHPTLQGSVRRYRIWFDSKRYRFDLDEVRPALPSDALHKRASYDGQTHRIIDFDRPDAVVREYSTEFLKGEPPPNAHSVFDPRLLGLACSEFAMLRHSSIDRMTSAFEKAKKQEVVIDPAKGQKAHVLATSHGIRYAFITEGKESFPSIIDQLRLDAALDFSDLMTRMSPRVTNTLVAVPSSDGRVFTYPSLVEYRKPDPELNLALLETVEVVKAEFNQPIDPEVLGWQALQPRVGALLTRDGRQTESLRWDGSNFVGFKRSDYDPLDQFANRPSRRLLLRLAAVGAIGLAILIALISLYKGKKS